MVECEKLDIVFGSLADATRRDILKRVSVRSFTISELAKPYRKTISFAGIAKHIGILEDAGLVVKKREGKYQIITLKPTRLREASVELARYTKMWEGRFSALDALLENN